MVAVGEWVMPGWGWAIFGIPCVIGIASGGQSIYDKLGGDWLSVLKTVPGWFYWLSRGAVPTVCYYVVFTVKLGGTHSIPTAFLCGLGSEAVLRSQFFIGSSKSADGKEQNIHKGVFDLVEWYQTILLRSASDRLAGGRQEFIGSMLGATTDFPALCEKIRAATGGFKMNREELRSLVDKTLAAFQKEATVKNGPAATSLHRQYAYELGFAPLDVVGREPLRTLFK